jgi:hypothetical protein
LIGYQQVPSHFKSSAQHVENRIFAQQTPS